MPLETANTIDQLVVSNPTSGDALAQTDDHLRLMKKTLKNTFPNIEGPVTASHEDLNGLEDRFGELEGHVILRDGSADFEGHQSMGGHRLTNLGDPVSKSDAATKKAVDDMGKLQKDYTDLVRDSLWPVGSVYINATSNKNPKDLLGFGTWQKFSEGRVLIGTGSGTDFRSETQSFSRGATGGAYRHKLTVSEMPRHSHPTTATESRRDGGGNSPKVLKHSSGQTGDAGGDQPHNNMQPYIAVNIWRRTA